MRIWFLGALVAWLFAASSVSAAEHPNVLLIAVDDLNNDLGCYGHKQVRSPHIDALARRGVRFDRAYCQYPLCNPSRASLLSGRRPDQTGVFDLETPPRTHMPDVVFLPEYFRHHGYRTAHVGKIFHTGDAFEDPASWDSEIRETGKHPAESAIVRSKKFSLPPKNNLEWDVLNTPDAQTADGVVAHQGSQLLEQLSLDGKPFFLAVGFRRPHQPYAAPEKYFQFYPPDQIVLPVEPAEHLTHIPLPALTYPPGTPPIAEQDRREIVAAYDACITFVDAQIGTLMETLDRLELWKNTIVVLFSDHGYHLGEHGGMWHKMSLFEQSARVPLIIAAPPGVSPEVPGMAQGSPVELIDIYPTLVDLCDLPVPPGLAGKSLRPLLKDPQYVWNKAAFTQVRRGDVTGRSVRTPRWRYTEWDEGRQGVELYDHDRDPDELVNLSDDRRIQGTRGQLSRLLREGNPAPAKE